VVLNIDDQMLLNVDKVSAIHKTFNGGKIVVDGVSFTVDKAFFEAIYKAFMWTHKSYMYDKKLKKIK